MTPSSDKSHGFIGVHLPPKPKGRASRQLKEQWLDVIELFMVLGISRPTHMARKTGLTFHTAKRWMQEVKDRWSGAVTEEQQNYRRELLYQEAESLARDAWRTVTASNNPSVVVGAFKAILEANERRAELSLPRLVKSRSMR